MHSLSYLATLYFWATCLSYDISIQVRCELIMQHAHSPYSGLADLYTQVMLSMHATYHTSLSPVTTHLYMNIHYEVPVVMDTVIC